MPVPLRFVVQQHHATAMHWDFRLEAEDGTLKSWAVPRGPALDPAEKRLAVRTEDHALSHIDYEGLISARRAGGGPVIIWDQGMFDNLSHDKRRPGIEVPVVDAVDRGHVSVRLHGHKLVGGFALTRTGRAAARGREQWLLVKMRDADADPSVDIVADRPESVVSGRTIDEVEALG
jgi:DNA ligase D-like protein (predicted 3'-phosphoesterase)